MSLEIGPEERKDRWTPIFVLVGGATAISIFAALRSSSPLLLFILPPALLLLLIGIGGLVTALSMRRVKLAGSVAAGLALFLGIFYCLPRINSGLEIEEFWRMRGFFDQMIAQERLRRSGGELIRMVVDFQDQSAFVTSTQFYYIVYDETDRAATDPSSISGYWPCPGSSTGVISVEGIKSIKSLRNHLSHRLAVGRGSALKRVFSGKRAFVLGELSWIFRTDGKSRMTERPLTGSPPTFALGAFQTFVEPN